MEQVYEFLNLDKRNGFTHMIKKHRDPSDININILSNTNPFSDDMSGAKNIGMITSR